ncbi:efflux RND transporter periplasmic adaptor subunit [Dyella sp. 2RAB6]|uniref:efflux RND transporter periplasmic adaptor subunit n=1 Tax=Dyella sp. 2RAB6 TaxID=3232992 RepID=UPI003F928778
MSRFWKIALIVIAVIIVGGVGFRLMHKPGEGQGGQAAGNGQGGSGKGGDGKDKEAPVPVTVEPVVKRDVPVYLTALGTVQALNTVTINPQVSGQLMSLKFTEGQEVKQGDVLAEIDPRTFQANYQQALGKKAQDEALLATARANLARSQNLAPQGYISKQDLDTQRNQVSQYQAAVAADVAAIASSQVQLGFTKVISPIDGVTGIRGVDPGNLVTTTSTIVTITQLHPIYVMFTLPEQNLEAVRNASRASTDPLQVTALDRVDAHAIANGGQLKVIDNQIDTTTGTFRLRSQFANEKGDLWPGQFVNVRLQVRTVAGGLVIPSQAVQRGPDGDYVYQMQADNTVKMQPVKVAGEVGDSHVMIGAGLKEGDQVVTEGQFRLKPGSKVKGLKPGEVPAAPTAEELQQQGKKGQRNGGGRRGG